MITNPYCFFDFETGSRVPETTQPLQIAAVLVDPIKLTIIEGSEFSSYMKPIFDKDECAAKGIAPLEDEALNINNITIETLEEAPPTKLVWENFNNHIKKFQKGKGSQWNAPIPAGFNIIKFDMIIASRLCKEFGPYSEKDNRQTLFHMNYYFDLYQTFFQWFENWNQVNNFTMDKLREILGLSTEGAHDALVDTKQGAQVMIRFLQMYRNLNSESSPRIKFKGTMSNVKI